MTPLVVGIGNPLRGDDGVGYVVAGRIAEHRPDIEVVMTHQLVPELVASITAARLVVFVDAAAGGTPGDVRCAGVHAGRSAGGSGHRLTPATLMALALETTGAAPQAWLVTIHASSFDIGSPLSHAVEQALPTAIDTVLSLLPE